MIHRVAPCLAMLASIVLAAPAAGASPPTDGVSGFGAAVAPSPTGASLPVVALATTPSGNGYWLATVTGQVLAAGDASVLGSVSPAPVSRVVGIAATPSGNGYWVAEANGAVEGFGDAGALGSLGSLAGTVLNAPIVGIAATPSGHGYWLVASDGGIFSFGDAVFQGSTGAMHLNAPIVGMTSTPSGHGYWLVASDGGIFSFGDAVFQGSTGAMQLNAPIVGMAPSASSSGYWLVASDGGIFSFGDAVFQGSSGADPGPVAVGIARSGSGYVVAYGELPAAGDQSVGHLQELLAALSFLPVTWTPAGLPPGAPIDAQVASVAPVSDGAFAWRWTAPPSLAALWQPNVANVMTTGAVMAFEAQEGLPTDGVAGPAVWAALDTAATGAAGNPSGYTYALASKSTPETLTVWHDGTVIAQTPANTGIAAAPTVDGTFPVYERLRSQIMTGTNPDGTPYADPVQWVAYFNGGDAIHYIARSSWGYPQSLGCVEVPYAVGQSIWPYLGYGTLVTVAG